ncbi:MAG TPA: quinoprotein amine dehydrogenase [Burkholderiaceae bacterium]|nr:quinoprotein amine dehydrogenase [Burkholderiaceae bacterium]
MHRLWSALTLACLLTACGGGGGGGTTAAATGAALTFAPGTLAVSVAAGTSATATVNASVNRPADFDSATVFAYLVDGAGVLLPNAQLVHDSSLAYHATVQTAPTLATGRYQGNFTVKLCRDSGCASQYPGSPMLLPYDIQVTPAGTAPFSASSSMPLTVTLYQGGALPAPVAISVQAGGRSWTAASGAPWLVLGSTSGSGNATVTASYAAASLAPGQYSTAITLTAGDGQVATLPVTLTVLAPAFQLNSDGVVFTAINGAPIAPQSVQFAINNAQATRWDAASSAPWLRASPSQGYTPATSTLSIDPTVGPLASGSYSATLTLTANGIAPRQLPVSLQLVRPTLLASSATVTLGGTYGRDFSARTMTLSLNTGSNQWPWLMSAPPAWANANALSGNVGNAGSAVLFTPSPAAAPVGSSSARVLVTATVNSELVTIPVMLALNKDQHKLLPAETGVAMSSTAGWSRLSRTIAMVDNYGQTPAWTAASDKAWLTVGGSGASLSLAADPSGLATNSLNYATVTVTPTDGTMAASAIQVAVWKGSASPAAPMSPHPLYRNVVADPIRPLVYAHNGGTSVDVYHVYTGQLVDTLTGFGGALGDMAVSADGALLYAYDLDHAMMEVRVLATKAVQQRWSLAHRPDRSARLALLRPNGVDLVALNDGSLFSSTGKLLASLPIQGGTLSAAPDGKRLYVQDEGGTAIHLATYGIDYAAVGGGTVFAALLPAATHLGSGSGGQDLAASADGNYLYAASSTPTQCSVLNTRDLGTLSYLASGGYGPTNVEVGSDGRIYCGVAGKSATTADVWVYDALGVLHQQLKFVPAGRQLAPRQMVISGDGFMLIGLNDDGVLNIVPVGP